MSEWGGVVGGGLLWQGHTSRALGGTRNGSEIIWLAWFRLLENGLDDGLERDRRLGHQLSKSGR